MDMVRITKHPAYDQEIFSSFVSYLFHEQIFSLASLTKTSSSKQRNRHKIVPVVLACTLIIYLLSFSGLKNKGKKSTHSDNSRLHLELIAVAWLLCYGVHIHITHEVSLKSSKNFVKN